MLNDKWKPTNDDIEWTKNHFGNMAVGDTWSVSGAIVEKTDKDELTLRQYPPESAMAIERVALVCNEFDVEFISEHAELIENPMEAAQNAAKQWADPESGIPLANFDLANPTWSVTAVPSQDETGNAVLIDQWIVTVTHPNDEEEGEVHSVNMTPMDYHLIAGDDLFFTWRNLRVIERQEAIRLADEGLTVELLLSKQIILLGSELIEDENYVVPPHLRGMMVTRITDEEE